MSYENPIESAASGAVKGTLDWTNEAIQSLISKFKNGNLAFIQDKETIELVKEQYDSGELKFYKMYINNNDLLFIVKLGLTLRKLDNNRERKQNLRSKILKRYSVKGLHIAQCVENGILNRYIGILIQDIISIEDFKRKIIDALENIEKYVLFVQFEDQEKTIVDTVRAKVFAHNPSIFIISGIASAADTIRKCEKIITLILSQYELEKMSSGDKETLFYKLKIK
ncbi:MAG TPA: hypothetical protein VJK51_03520 [Candidatus Nanoarchaeia archaeon]|nr:hypothetical protein [Candidatus Nanoarchaeia archaeon]